MDDIAANLAEVRAHLNAACRQARRAPAEVTLVAVTKTVPVERIAVAAALGLHDVGENRVQEAQQKIADLVSLPLRWHLIGHLQSNKVRVAAGLFQMVQSVDSADVARLLNRRAAGSRPLPVLLEVNISGEAAKFGFRSAGGDWSALYRAVEEILSLPALDVQGLMTVAPLAANPEAARPVFAGLRALRDDLRERFPERRWQHLSMGMTDDYPVAIEEGATIVRLGRAIFGARPPAP